MNERSPHPPLGAAGSVSGGAALRVAVSGASGLVGSALVHRLRAAGHDVRALVRRAAGPGEIAWDPARGTVDAAALAGVHAVVHLAGAGIADRPWTPERKREIRDSRVQGTDALARAIAAMNPQPHVFVSASAVGWWGDGGDAELREDGPAGTGFLADTCRAWEEAAAPAAAAGVRVVHPRIGLVLTPDGGALAKLLTPFRLGAGGPLGSGRQWWSWITLDDLVAAIEHAIVTEALVGPFAAVSPEPVRMAEFARVLGRVLGRPSWLTAPAFALRTLLGAELADAVLLSGQRVRPGRLVASGFVHGDPVLEPALRRLLGRSRA